MKQKTFFKGLHSYLRNNTCSESEKWFESLQHVAYLVLEKGVFGSIPDSIPTLAKEEPNMLEIFFGKDESVGRATI